MHFDHNDDDLKDVKWDQFFDTFETKILPLYQYKEEAHFINLLNANKNMDNKQKIIDNLNELLEKNYDAEKGYRKAAENTEDQLLSKLLISEADKRRNFGIKIKDEIAKLGGMPDKGDSQEAKVHRTWIDIKAALAPKKDNSIVEECIRGERNAISDYEEVLSDSELTPSSRKVVQQQREDVTDSLKHLQNYKNKH